MEDWTAAEVALVMDEIGRRVQLLRRLQPLVKNPEANELHEIHPLFARGLWMFGREFETRDFLSNRTLCTVIADLLKGEVHQQDHRRPDLVVLPESTVTVHADDAYNSDSEPDGLSKVLIIELKKGGSTIGEREYNQGQSYATALRRENVVQRDTEIVVYVLGARVDEVVGDGQMHDHRTFLYPRSYDTIIGAAQSRTFHLERRLEALSQSVTVDEEVEIAMTEQLLEMTPDTDLE
jgi:hypothetical protein